MRRVGLAVAVGIGVYALRGRRSLLRWGATDAEATGPAPGDDVISHPVSVSTMAVTYDASPAEIWPWLVQMGTGRAGWYSWDLIDNYGRPSAEEILPEHQAIAVGELLPASRSGARAFEVVALSAERYLVLRARWGAAVAIDSTWSLHLRQRRGGGTRLVVRARTTGRPLPLVRAAEWVFHEPGHLLMQIRQFRGLRVRVDR